MEEKQPKIKESEEQNENLYDQTQANDVTGDNHKQKFYNKGQQKSNKTYNKKKWGYQNNQVEKIDPYTVQLMIYQAEMYILMRYPHLAELNKRNEGISRSLEENSQFFVIKSYSEEDVHKAIKYNVWTSTKHGNKTLNNSYKFTSKKGGNVYLFFSCNGSGRFLGIAKMKKEVEFDKFFPFWTQDNKWGGLFEIEWMFIKDVPFKQFKEIIITMTDGIARPVAFSRDTQEVPFKDGKIMMELIENYFNTNTILEHFEYYDIRQENYERSNPIQLYQNQTNELVNSENQG